VIVLDASAMVEWLLRLPHADDVERELNDPGRDLHAPYLLDVEVAQVVRRLASAGHITHTRGREALEDLAALDLVRHGHELLLPAIWRLRGDLTAYDAAYVALAEVLEAPLLTLDTALAAAPGHDAGARLIR
jgi:predicted nucleic acid-binding protein